MYLLLLPKNLLHKTGIPEDLLGIRDRVETHLQYTCREKTLLRDKRRNRTMRGRGRAVSVQKITNKTVDHVNRASRAYNFYIH
jgi:hypothetical protein